MFAPLNSLSNKMRVFRIFLLILIAVNIAFIFTQSTLPPEVVEQEKGSVGEILDQIIDPETNAGQYAQENMDKLAHFTEFAILGFLTSLYVCLYGNRRNVLAMFSLIFALAIAIIDETIQKFSGRCSDVADVLSDLVGFVSLSTITYIVSYAIRRLGCKKE